MAGQAAAQEAGHDHLREPPRAYCMLLSPRNIRFVDAPGGAARAHEFVAWFLVGAVERAGKAAHPGVGHDLDVGLKDDEGPGP